MISSDDYPAMRARNDALRAELIAASRKTEHLVTASEEFFEKRERFRKNFARLRVSAGIEPALGFVRVTGDRRITIELDDAAVAVSDPSQLGARVLTALAQAEHKLDEVAAKIFGEAPLF